MNRIIYYSGYAETLDINLVGAYIYQMPDTYHLLIKVRNASTPYYSQNKFIANSLETTILHCTYTWVKYGLC